MSEKKPKREIESKARKRETRKKRRPVKCLAAERK